MKYNNESLGVARSVKMLTAKIFIRMNKKMAGVCKKITIRACYFVQVVFNFTFIIIIYDLNRT